MSDKIKWMPFDIAERFMEDVFRGLGVPYEEARVCAEVLITADKRGIDSHGIARLKTIYYDRIKSGIQKSNTYFQIIKETPTTLLIDGNDGMGHVIAKKSMSIAIKRAKKYGTGMVAVRNSTHYGIAGYYTMMAAEEGMIGITGTNARPSVAPTFGVEPLLGTNPLTIGLPTDEEFPFVIDCATSLSQRGKIEVYAREGKPLPAGWVIDREGNSVTDSKKVLKMLVDGSAACTPLGGIGEEGAGYKGFGYATAVEIMCAALQEGSYLRDLSGFKDGVQGPYHLGHFFIAINIENFTDIRSFKRIAGNILRDIRSSAVSPDAQKIFTAGEKEYLCWLDRKEKGVPLNEENIKELIIMRDELKLDRYDFNDILKVY